MESVCGKVPLYVCVCVCVRVCVHTCMCADPQANVADMYLFLILSQRPSRQWKNRISSLSGGEKKEGTKEKWMLLCAGTLVFSHLCPHLIPTFHLNWCNLNWWELLSSFLHRIHWIHLTSLSFYLPRSQRYQHTQPVYPILSRLFFLCHITSQCDLIILTHSINTHLLT